METAVVLLLVLIVGMLAVVIRSQVRPRETLDADSGAAASPGELVPAPAAAVTEPLVDVVRSSDGGFQLREKLSGAVVLDVHPVPASEPSRIETRPRAVPPSAALITGLSGVGVDVGSVFLAGPQYLVRFSPEVQHMLKEGTAALMKTKAGVTKADAVRVATHTVLEHGSVVEAFGPSAGTSLGSGLVAAAAAFQMYEIQKALETIERKLDELIDRARDDDHGELDAAEALIAPLLGAAANGRVPPQLARELAVHRQRVESIYFSRQRFVERFRDELEARQERHAEKNEEPRAWARGAKKAFGDREAFEAEVLIYARAMTIRARLALCTAGVVALDGQAEVGQWMLRDVGEETADAFGDLARRLHALAQEDPGWTWIPLSGRKELQETARSLANLFETQIAPQLPARTTDTIEFCLEIGPGEASPEVVTADAY